MDIGEPKRVIDVPDPIKFPKTIPRKEPDRQPSIPMPFPITIPSKEPVPVRRGGGWGNILQRSELPHRCSKCGRGLQESGLLSFMLTCPRHGVVWRE